MRKWTAVLVCSLAGMVASSAQTGVAVPELSSLDRDIPALMESLNVPGGAVAVVKDGRLVFARGFGVADIQSREPVEPDALFRIGSISKTVTATAILNLVENGRLDLEAKAYAEILSQLQPPPGVTVDPRLKNVSVRQLLHHTGGHGRDTGTDPLNIGLIETAAEVLHTPKPPSYETIVRYAMGQPLDFDPGTKYSYSNFGFMVLARVVERVSGQPYEDFVRRNVLAPMGIRRMALGRTLPEDRLPGEVRYYDTPRAPLQMSIFPDIRRMLPRPYAQFELVAADGCGQWVASAIDLVRFVARVEGTRQPALLQPATFQLLLERPEPFVSADPTGGSWYAMGTGAYFNNGGLAWTHTGAYPGNVAGYRSDGNGFVYAYVFNSWPADLTRLENEADRILYTLGANQKNWPDHDLFPRYYPED